VLVRSLDVICIWQPAASQPSNRLGRWNRSVIDGGWGDVARAWAKRRPKLPRPRIWILGVGAIVGDFSSLGKQYLARIRGRTSHWVPFNVWRCSSQAYY